MPRGKAYERGMPAAPPPAVGLTGFGRGMAAEKRRTDSP